MSAADHSRAERVLALAGLMQALTLVHRVAHSGGADGAALEATLGSVLRVDADSTQDVYGGVASLRLGLQALVGVLERNRQEPMLARMAATVLHVERRLAARPAMLSAIGDGIRSAQRQSVHLGLTHPTVLGNLGELYARTISSLRPRVLVQGNPQYLSQTAVVAEIRALLLAAVRSAVLWRQLGGGYLELLLRRRALADDARRWLDGLPPDDE